MKKENASKEAKDYAFCVVYNRRVIIGGGITDSEKNRYDNLKEWYKKLTYAKKKKFNKELY